MYKHVGLQSFLHWMTKNILLHSILFYSILFYSIPFHSVLFYSHVLHATLLCFHRGFCIPNPGTGYWNLQPWGNHCLAPYRISRRGVIVVIVVWAVVIKDYKGASVVHWWVQLQGRGSKPSTHVRRMREQSVRVIGLMVIRQAWNSSSRSTNTNRSVCVCFCGSVSVFACVLRVYN